jgi:SpoIID/LytB domain protein
VGIIEAPEIDFCREGQRWRARYVAEGQIAVSAVQLSTVQSVSTEVPAASTVRIESDIWLWESPFTLPAVTIGKEFHWQQQEAQTFAGVLQIKALNGRLVAINHVPVETYLRSVIASEMSADNNLELLRTHAVISRSWVLRQIKDEGNSSVSTPPSKGSVDGQQAPKQAPNQAMEKIIQWFDHSDHTDFDVCADDHCQRYQGLTRVSSPVVDEAIALTRGEVLVSTTDGSLCDARFSKCCGGMTEAFEVCWQDTPFDYLQPVLDAPAPGAPAFCDTQDPRVLRLVLNTYDRSTTDFYRWTVSYTRAELSDLIERKMHWGLGEVLHLRPLKRGRSGRIYELEIEGTQRTLIVGKELMIRKALSESHLYSSAFTVEEEGDTFKLHGSGWGHGVGLCQIGAACMSLRGYTYRRILAHYFPHTEVKSLY